MSYIISGIFLGSGPKAFSIGKISDVNPEFGIRIFKIDIITKLT